MLYVCFYINQLVSVKKLASLLVNHNTCVYNVFGYNHSVEVLQLYKHTIYSLYNLLNLLFAIYSLCVHLKLRTSLFFFASLQPLLDGSLHGQSDADITLTIEFGILGSKNHLAINPIYI